MIGEANGIEATPYQVKSCPNDLDIVYKKGVHTVANNSGNCLSANDLFTKQLFVKHIQNILIAN